MTTELARVRGPVAAPGLGPEAQLALDLAVGVARVTFGAAVVVARATSRVTGPAARFLWNAPVLPTRLRPATIAGQVARAGHSERVELESRVRVLLDAWTPQVVAALVERVDLTRLVEQHLDLDELVATVDLDAAVARVDLDAAVARVAIEAVLDRVDLDAVAARLDVDAVVARADLDAAVARVDIDAVIDRVDLDAVAARLDVDAVVARADLDAAVARVDIDAVIDRVDLVHIVEEVLEEIDLPALIRDSTGAMKSETVRGVRMTGVSADDALSRAVDRALFRRRRPVAPGAAL